jgi:peroxiredoxin
MQQIVDLQNDPEFQSLDVAFLSIAFDSSEVLRKAGQQIGVYIPLLSDSDHSVSEAYGVLKWAVASGEPGHTFVLIDESGTVVWIQDYGAPENRGVMYAPIDELVREIKSHLDM